MKFLRGLALLILLLTGVMLAVILLARAGIQAVKLRECDPDKDLKFVYIGSSGEYWVANRSGTENFALENSNIFSPVSWSPEGSKIAYQSDRDNNPEIYVVNADGTHPRNLTNHPDADTHPVWSPDGSKIAFISSRDGSVDVFIMNADGNSAQNISRRPGDKYFLMWSPDGQQLAFASQVGFGLELFLYHLARQSLGHFSGLNPWTGITWSPNSSVLALGGLDKVSQNNNILLLDAGRGLSVNLTNNLDFSFNGAPQWSPDGRHILYWTDRDGNNEIYIAAAYEGTPRNLTQNPADDIFGVWSPMGQEVIFSSDRDGSQRLYRMNLDGSNQQVIADQISTFGYTWQPC